MLIGIFFIVITILSMELFLAGMVMGFFQRKFIISDSPGFFLSSLITSSFLGIGYLLGNYSASFLSHYALWYAATVLFILGLKMFYDGIKLHKSKQLINPLDVKGLILYSVLAGLNAFFIGLAFGLIQLNYKLIFTSFLLFLSAIILGYLLGFKAKKLPSYRFEFVSGLFYILIAIKIATYLK